MTLQDIPIGSKVELTRDLDGLSKGSTGIVIYTSFGRLDIDHIEGEYTPYCDYCDSHTCDCEEEEDWFENHGKSEEFCIYDIKHIKVLSTPQVDTLILLV